MRVQVPLPAGKTLGKEFFRVFFQILDAERSVGEMTCQEAEKMVIPYINDELTVSQMEDFLDHIETCANCREELEIHYMVDIGLKKLDEADATYDIVGDLRRKLEDSYSVLRRCLMFQITRYAVSTLMTMALIVTVLLQVRIWNQAGF